MLQSGVEFDALSDGVPYPTPLRQTSRGCGQLFTVLLELPAPPWVGAHMYTHSTGLHCVAMVIALIQLGRATKGKWITTTEN